MEKIKLNLTIAYINLLISLQKYDDKSKEDSRTHAARKTPVGKVDTYTSNNSKKNHSKRPSQMKALKEFDHIKIEHIIKV